MNTDLSGIAALARAHRQAGRRIVLANGCFDLLHVGHIEFLTEAKRQSDILIVGINSDRSILRNKGHAPTFGAEARMTVLTAMQAVDYAFIFDTMTFNMPIRIIKPDLYVKGVDKADKVTSEELTARNLNISVATLGERKKSSSELSEALLSRYLSDRTRAADGGVYDGQSMDKEPSSE